MGSFFPGTLGLPQALGKPAPPFCFCGFLRYPETTYGSGALFTWGWGELRFSKVTATVAVTSMPQVAVVKGGGIPGRATP